MNCCNGMGTVGDIIFPLQRGLYYVPILSYTHSAEWRADVPSAWQHCYRPFALFYWYGNKDTKAFILWWLNQCTHPCNEEVRTIPLSSWILSLHLFPITSSSPQGLGNIPGTQQKVVWHNLEIFAALQFFILKCEISS